jgi:hypothetical protein
MIWFPHKLSQSHSNNKDISFSSYANCPGTSQSSRERYDLETVDQLHMVNSLSQEVPKIENRIENRAVLNPSIPRVLWEVAMADPKLSAAI